MGGLTAFIALGATFDGKLYNDFCLAHPGCPICPPGEALPMFDRRHALYPDWLKAEIERMSDDRHKPAARAGFFIAATAIGLRPNSLRGIGVPVSIVVGAEDVVTGPEVGAHFAASLISGAQLVVVPGAGHDSFVNLCTPAGVDAGFCGCATASEQSAAHRLATDRALSLFNTVLR